MEAEPGLRVEAAVRREQPVAVQRAAVNIAAEFDRPAAQAGTAAAPRQGVAARKGRRAAREGRTPLAQQGSAITR
jgi:hypothetical protein